MLKSVQRVNPGALTSVDASTGVTKIHIKKDNIIKSFFISFHPFRNLLFIVLSPFFLFFSYAIFAKNLYNNLFGKTIDKYCNYKYNINI